VQQGAGRLEPHVLALMRSVEESPEVGKTLRPPIKFDLNVPTDAGVWAEAKLTELSCNQVN